MKLLIEIDDEIYKFLNKQSIKPFKIDNVLKAIANGTVLPKGHGDLIDRNKLKQAMKIGYRIVDDAETVIKADSEVE